MFRKVLVDVEAIIELPNARWGRQDIEARARHLEYEAKDLESFIRDHRSRDDYGINIRRIYESRCEFCGCIEERFDDGSPVCCEAATKEWEAERSKALSSPT